MSRSLRVAVCSNCGHLLVRAASCSGNPTRNRTLQYYSRRGISWGSLFDHLKPKRREERDKVGGEGAGGKELGGGIEVEESRRRAERIVREVRLKREQFGRTTAPPPPPPVSSPPPASSRSSYTNSKSTFYTISQSDQETSKKESPHEILKEALRTQSRSPFPPPRPTLFNSIPPSYPSSKPTPTKSDILLTKKGNPFLSPLKAEQKAAMQKYLLLATKDPDTRKRKKFPWEEKPVDLPWEKTANDKWAGIRRLLNLRTIQSKQSTSSRIQRGLAEEGGRRERGEGRLFELLRDEHVRCLVGYSGPGSRVAEDANKELRRRIMLVIGQARKGPGQDFSLRNEFEREMNGVFGVSMVQGVVVTAFVKYVLAREGFDPGMGEVMRKDGVGVYDELGNVEMKVLAGINDEKLRELMGQLGLSNRLIPHLVKRTHTINNDSPTQTQDTSSLFTIITHQTCIPISDHRFERHSIIISLDTGTILFSSKELIELYTTDQHKRIALKDINRGKLSNELEFMGKLYTKWRKEIKVITELYDF